MTSSESLRGVGPAGRGAPASERARTPRADRIEIDFSWSDHDDFGAREPSSRRRSHRVKPREERFARHAPEHLPTSLETQDLPTASPGADTARAPQPVAAPEPSVPAAAEPVIGAAPGVAVDPRAAVDPSVAVHPGVEPGGEVAGGLSGGPMTAPPARRTVVIKGQGTRGYAPSRGGYEARLRPHERSGFKPDRVALWAVLLGLALLLGAVTSSHAATLHAGALHHLLLHHALVHIAP